MRAQGYYSGKEIQRELTIKTEGRKSKTAGLLAAKIDIIYYRNNRQSSTLQIHKILLF